MRPLAVAAFGIFALTSCAPGVARLPASSPSPSAGPTVLSLEPTPTPVSSPSNPSNPTASPSLPCQIPVSQPRNGRAPTAVYVMYAHTDACDTWALHVVSMGGGTPTDRVVAAAKGYLSLLAATGTVAIVDDGGSIDGSDMIREIDLNTAATRDLTAQRNLGTGTNWESFGALSLDQTQIAIGVGHSLSTLNLASGAVRKLVTSTNGRFYEPLRWTSAGILANERPYADFTTQFDLIRVNASSGAVSPVYQLAPQVVSPNGSMMAIATNSNLGDDPCSCQFQNWQNTLSVGAVGAVPGVVATQKNHSLDVVDVADDGEVMYISDASDGTGKVLASDGGLYVSRNGHTTLQLRTVLEGQWSYGVLLNPATALVSEAVGGYNQTAAAVLVVHLCPDPTVACTVTTAVVAQTPARWASGPGRIEVIQTPA